jgi:dTDP-4-dehydrorhamnose 3,5-epimerase
MPVETKPETLLRPGPPGAPGLQANDTSIPGVLEIQPKVFRDARGFFLETYHQQKFAELGIHETFVQDNHSRSAKGTLRGLHYQVQHAQAKLCRVIEGEALDVAVDIRLGSPTFGKWTSVVLSAERQNMIFIPQGFAHGFLALTDSVQFLYKCSDVYDPSSEHGILWNDPDLAIDWGVSKPLISDKDARNLTLAAMPREFLPKYSRK